MGMMDSEMRTVYNLVKTDNIRSAGPFLSREINAGRGSV